MGSIPPGSTIITLALKAADQPGIFQSLKVTWVKLLVDDEGLKRSFSNQKVNQLRSSKPCSSSSEGGAGAGQYTSGAADLGALDIALAPVLDP